MLSSSLQPSNSVSLFQHLCSARERFLSTRSFPSSPDARHIICLLSRRSPCYPIMFPGAFLLRGSIWRRQREPFNSSTHLEGFFDITGSPSPLECDSVDGGGGAEKFTVLSLVPPARLPCHRTKALLSDTCSSVLQTRECDSYYQTLTVTAACGLNDVQRADVFFFGSFFLWKCALSIDGVISGQSFTAKVNTAVFVKTSRGRLYWLQQENINMFSPTPFIGSLNWSCLS